MTEVNSMLEAFLLSVEEKGRFGAIVEHWALLEKVRFAPGQKERKSETIIEGLDANDLLACVLSQEADEALLACQPLGELIKRKEDFEWWQWAINKGGLEKRLSSCQDCQRMVSKHLSSRAQSDERFLCLLSTSTTPP